MQNNFCEVGSYSKASHLYTFEAEPREPKLTGENVSRDGGAQENLRGKNRGGTFTNQRQKMVQRKESRRQRWFWEFPCN